MPIEIKELVIRTQVGPAEDTGASSERGEGGGRVGSGAQGSALDIEQLVQECVRQVMRILAQQRER